MNNDQKRQAAFIRHLLQSSKNSSPLTPQKACGVGTAPVNIALSKYWGKRDKALNLPINGSVSISLPGLGTETRLKPINAEKDRISLNGKPLADNAVFAERLSRFLDWFRDDRESAFEVETHNTVPTAAGLASSASGYAALVLALDDLFDWQLPKETLSLLARFGSGSASRSLFNGFAIWHRGSREDGLDSFAEPLQVEWPDLTIGLVKVNTGEKPVGSTAGMQQTVETCDLYQSWPQQAERDLQTIINAIKSNDFSTMGKTAEHNALSMHATMIATWPPIVYWQPESLSAMQLVWSLREQNIEVYFTMDAGPNLKLLLQEKDRAAVQKAFQERGIGIEFLHPFSG
ncbi:diphosphomevalonate decarboxylase [Thiomicrorhabdus xiamenensis]|uniref:diphosphomevalonate decarboxylase n=1 Tax=Thiomicrorhabdus xiamenensis TaxID=2739063 RepID=A0A7D4TDJ1_9GAMM|nr:diphosphomevalonate decarboxylase [Thiomicrorhabdus xiamenensis]QKI88667.1 diphosphomevalonate decarboxylase [Thiomicrorhabdus xiamenensis]